MDPQAEAIDLFRIAESKIENLRDDISEMVRHDVELQIKMDRLTDRVDNGVSVTGQKTLAAVTELVTKIGEYKIQQDHHAHTLASHEKLLDRLITAVFVTATVGVIGGLVAVLWEVIKHVGRV